MRESDLYAPVKAYFEQQGFEVKAEIEQCDMIAIREEQVVAVELKLGLNLDVVLQAMTRRKIADLVYVAVPDKRMRRNRHQGIRALFRQLDMGLITVNMKGKAPEVLELTTPKPLAITRPRRGKLRSRAIGEFQRRQGDPNVGGSTGVERMTSYRQDALELARVMRCGEVYSGKKLKQLTGCQRAWRILYDNHYGWFDRVDKGGYRLNEKGVSQLCYWEERMGAENREEREEARAESDGTNDELGT